MPEILRPKTACVSSIVSLFIRALFRAYDLLVVQPDAWDRYAGRATLCSSSFARSSRQPSLRDAPLSGAALRYIHCVKGIR